MKPLSTFYDCFLKNPDGFALLPIILAITIAGLFLTAGLSLIDAKATQNKYEVSQKAIEATVCTIVGWSQQNGRLPDFTEFTAITGSKEDAWRQPLIYIYDANLTNTSSGGICGRRNTSINTTDISDIAFIIISAGNDFFVDSTPNASGSFSGTAGLSSNDIVKPVQLNHLQGRLCFHQDELNRLEILNLELPEACEGEAYTADIFAKGGVTPYSWSYVSKPGWLILSGNANSYRCQGTPPTAGSYQTEIVLLDALGNSIQKQYDIIVKSCP